MDELPRRPEDIERFIKTGLEPLIGRLTPDVLPATAFFVQPPSRPQGLPGMEESPGPSNKKDSH